MSKPAVIDDISDDGGSSHNDDDDDEDFFAKMKSKSKPAAQKPKPK